MSKPALSWDDVATFLAVIRERSLSGAARRLGLAQPTIRRQTAALEAELRVALFTRAQNGLTPTPAALALVPHAEAIESAVGSFSRFASSRAGEATGSVRLTCSTVFGSEILPPIMAELLHDHGGLELELVPTDRNQDLLRRDADIAVRLARPTQSALLARRARPVELGFFAHPAYLAGREPPATYEALSTDFEFIGPDKDRSFADGLAAIGLSLPARISFRTDDTLAQLAAIRAGIGIGICQAQIAARYGLVRILPAVATSLECWVVMHEDLRSVPRIRLVFDRLVKALAHGG